MDTPDALGEGLLSPPPAGSEATEDGGQRYAEDKSGSELSDKYPAGPDRTPFASGAYASIETSRERRRVSVDVRYTVPERDAIRHRARALGVKPSKWVRAVVLDALDARRDHVGMLTAVASSTPSPEVSQSVEQLRRVGVNLNQALRRGVSVDDDLLREVRAAVDDLRGRLGDRTTL